jgi:serine/threonine protein kinase
MDNLMSTDNKYNINIGKYFKPNVCESITKLLEESQIIGKGTWANVYRIQIKKCLFSVKMQKIKSNKTFDDVRDIEGEVNVLKQLSHFKELNHVEFFPYYYFDTICNGSSLIFYQHYEHSLEHLFGKWTQSLFRSIVMQAIYSVHLFRTITNRMHNDIRLVNFLIVETNDTTKWYDGHKIQLEGYHVVLWDYANSTEGIDEKDTDMSMIKLMFKNYIKSTIYEQCEHGLILEFARDKNLSIDENNDKWQHIKNSSVRTRKIKTSNIKALIYKIIENSMLLEFLQFVGSDDLMTVFIEPELLEWVDTLPNTIKKSLRLLK